MRTSTIDVRLGPDDELAGAVRATAARLGATLRIADGSSPTTVVGDVELPDDAERWRVEAALLRALAPRHLLFLCVANSARSQLAEGLARELAAGRVTVSSAGSAPTSPRPQAVSVLAEIGIDISSHRSTSVDDVAGTVDAVITLCAEEVCPVWLGDAWRLHWGLPDPAAVTGSEEEKLDAFRAVRDELHGRLRVLLG